MFKKDEEYHKAAIQYNEEAAEFFAGLADRIDHSLVKKWCSGISKQHTFHQGRHERALDKLENSTSAPEPTPEETPQVSSIVDEQAAFAAEMSSQEDAVIEVPVEVQDIVVNESDVSA